jgi:hypothetical protein
MKIAELQKRLLAAARTLPPSEVVPFAFEKRIMAQLASISFVDTWTLWSRLLWRAAAPSIAIMLVVGMWTFFSEPTNSAETLASDLEQTLLAPLAQLESNSW